MQKQGVERREFQRLRLNAPIPARFGDAEVTLVEVGILGARIEHVALPESARADLEFTFGGSVIHMRCEIVRTLGEMSGLRFLAAVGESGDHLRDMLSQLVVKAIEEHHDSSATRLRIRQVDGDKTVRGVDANFHSYHFEGGAWKRRPVLLPEQPPTGFTVPRGEDAEEMQRLCEVFEASDEEGRRLIRLFAELSVTGVLQIPPRT
jgi:hypothetical protein